MPDEARSLTEQVFILTAGARFALKHEFQDSKITEREKLSASSSPHSPNRGQMRPGQERTSGSWQESRR
jgi:hypothetical protein